MGKTTRLTVKEVLTRQVADILPSRKGLEKLMGQKKIRLYLGIDPTGAKLHLGHAIGLRKLQQFADLGHHCILVIGTGTVLAGDPSQRDTARPRITKQEIARNIRAWGKQVAKILDFRKVEIRNNGDWLNTLTIPRLLEIGSHISAVQLFQREMFQRRIQRGDTVWTHEILYPLLQGYDSVVLDVDLEIGGTDQLFNMLVGRELQEKMGGKEKFVLTLPLIPGLDGKPMSKTSRNAVNILEPAKEMYGKLMTLHDRFVALYFELCTDIPRGKIRELAARLSPRDLKAHLAKAVVAMYHGPRAAQEAEEEFVRVFRKKELPEDIPAFRLAGQTMSLMDLLVRTKITSSKSEARRLVMQKGVKVNGVVQEDWRRELLAEKGTIVQVGKRHFAKIV